MKTIFLILMCIVLSTVTSGRDSKLYPANLE